MPPGPLRWVPALSLRAGQFGTRAITLFTRAPCGLHAADAAELANVILARDQSHDYGQECGSADRLTCDVLHCPSLSLCRAYAVVSELVEHARSGSALPPGSPRAEGPPDHGLRSRLGCFVRPARCRVRQRPSRLDVPWDAPSVACPHAHAACQCSTRRGDCADPGNRRRFSSGRSCLGSLPDTHERSGQRPLHPVFSPGYRMPLGHRSLLSPPSSNRGSPCRDRGPGSGRRWKHRLAEFNAEASFEDVKAVLTSAIAANAA
jgi:hypothetical protein